MGYPRRLGLVSVCLPLLAFVLSSSIAPRPAFAAYATLAWTSPSDNSGRAYTYDLRISTKAITGADTTTWWNAATRVSMVGRTPAMPGSPETINLGGLINGATYYAILKSADSKMNWSGYSNVASFVAVTAITGVDTQEVPELVLGAPRPSPTTGRADLNLDLPKSMNVDASVYDAQGRKVRTLESGVLAGGPHILHWDGRHDRGESVASGVYWILVNAEGITKRQKVVLVR